MALANHLTTLSSRGGGGVITTPNSQWQEEQQQAHPLANPELTLQPQHISARLSHLGVVRQAQPFQGVSSFRSRMGSGFFCFSGCLRVQLQASGLDIVAGQSHGNVWRRRGAVGCCPHYRGRVFGYREQLADFWEHTKSASPPLSQHSLLRREAEKWMKRKHRREARNAST